MGFLSKSKYRYQTPKYWKYLSPIHIFQSNQRKIFFSLNWTLIPFSKDCQKIPKPFKFFPIKVMKSLLIGKEVFNPCSKNFMTWNLLFNITCHNIPKKSLLIQIKIFGSRLTSKKGIFVYIFVVEAVSVFVFADNFWCAGLRRTPNHLWHRIRNQPRLWDGRVFLQLQIHHQIRPRKGALQNISKLCCFFCLQ